VSRLHDTRHAIAARLNSAIDDLQFSPYFLADPTPPTGHVFPTPVDYDETFQRGVDGWTLTVQIFVSEGSGDEAAQENLDEFLEPYGPRSVKEILEEPDSPDGSVTLGGIIDDLRVARSEGYRSYRREGRPALLGTEWIVEVAIPGREEE